jgi:hypothetical protein
MATDNTHLAEATTAAASDHQEFNPEVVQVAAADAATPPAPGQAAPVIPGVPNGEVTVTVPAGQTVVRVQVAPGETIDLPFDANLAAKFGQQGNLAIKVGDQTIILVGYAQANQQSGVTVKDAHGHAIDVATVVAQTDPNLDIQTAAGGTAGAQGAQGGHLFFNFGAGGNLGGFGELGPIDQTALQYQLIQPDEKILVIGEAPSIISIGVDNNGTVNEDDFHHTHHSGGDQIVTEALVIGGDSNGASQGLQDQLSADGNFSFVHFGNYKNGNDPYDTDDHEDGSQTNPAQSDNNNGIDQDREPLSTTAHVTVDFHDTHGGTLSFDHNGDTPIIDNLIAKNLTSHGNALSYELLPATATHGESIVAYYTTGEGEGACQVVVFSLEIEQPSGAQNSTFDIAFTIYGVLDNSVQGAGVLGEDSFDLNTIFFANAAGSPAFTESAPNALVFHDIDDVPELGHYTYSTSNGEGSGEPVSSTDTAVYYNPANLTIGLDETPGVQHTQYDRDTGKGDIDPTGALGQHTSQHTDDVGGSQAWHIEHQAETTINDILSQPADPTNEQLTYQQGVLAHLGLNPGDSFCTKALGAACSTLDVSFGADGKAEGDVQAGKTLFAHDGDANATAFQLYMEVGAHPDGKPIDSHLTNVWIDVDNGDGTFTKEQVTAYQLDANTIIGIAPAPEGKPVEIDGQNGDFNTEAAVQSAGGIPVFEIHIDPMTGELSVVQYHSVDNPNGLDPNDPLAIQTDDGQPLVQFRATDYDGDYVDAPLEVAIIDDAPVICKVTYCSPGTSDHTIGYVDEDYLTSASNNGVPGNHDHDTNPDNQNSPYGTNGNNDGDGPGGTHVTGQIQVQNEVDTPLAFSFHVAGLVNAGDTVASFLDADGHTVTSSDGHNIALTLTQVGSEWTITGSYTDASNVVHDVFTVQLDSLSGNFTFDLQGALGHPDHGPGPITSYEDNLNLSFGAQVTDSDGDPATTTLQFVVDDDQPAIVCQPVIDCTVSSDPHPRGEGECLSESTCSVTLDINNVPGWVSISATNDQGAPGSVGTSTGAGFGVDSNTDGSGQDRFHEINYDNAGGVGGTGGSESLTFGFGGHVVESATVELARFYSGENGVGDEQGHWAAYKGGVLVAEGDFTANSATGQFGLAIPTVAGGFDSLVFTATPGTHVTGQTGDESDYLVQQMELNLLPTDKQSGHFSYEFGADGGVEPSGNASTEAGLGFQAHYTGATLTSDGLPVTVTESVVNGHIIIEGTVAGPGGTTLPVFTMDVDPGTPSTSTGIATASYTYEQYAPLDNNHAGTNLPFQFVITDRDGDATSTEVCVCLKDAAPDAGNTYADVYEKGLDQPGTDHDGTDKGDGSNTTSGFLNFSYNGDGPGTISSISGQGHTDVTPDSSGQLVIDTSQFTLTVDQITGFYTFTLKQNLHHDDTSANAYDFGTNGVSGNPNSQQIGDLLKDLGFTYTVKDADGSTDTGNLTIKVHDDGPVVTSSWLGSSPVLETLDHQTIVGNDISTASASFKSFFSSNVVYGADGPGNTQISFTLNLHGNATHGVDSGLKSHGHEIYLSEGNDGKIYGTTSQNGTVNSTTEIFELDVDGNGKVTLNQYQELDHPTPGDSSNFDHQTISLPGNLVTLTGTVMATDSDGDHASSSSSLDLGSHIAFADDGPSAPTVTYSGSDGRATFGTVDEDNLSHTTNGGGNGVNAGDGNKDTDTTPGDDQGNTTTSGHYATTYGADGPGSTGLSGVVVKDDNGVTVLDTLNNINTLHTHTGASVDVVVTATSVIGYEQGHHDAAHEVFTMTLGANNAWTFTLLEALKEPIGDNLSTPSANESTEDNLHFDFSLVSQDFDGDTSQPGHILVSVDDDGPKAVADGLYTISSLNTNSTPELTGNNVITNDHVGADSPGSVVQVKLSTDQNWTTVNTATGGDIHTANGDLHINADGSWTYNQTSTASAPTTLDFVYRLSDSDGDTSTADLTIKLATGGGTSNVTSDLGTAPAYEDAASTTSGERTNDQNNTHLTLAFHATVTPNAANQPVDSATVSGIPTGATGQWTDGTHTVNFVAGTNNITGSTPDQIAFLTALEQPGGAPITVTLAKNDSHDVTLTVDAVVGGVATTGGTDHATAVVDTVAADPLLNHIADQTVNETGGANTTFTVSVTVNFADIQDAGEHQQVLLGNLPAGWTVTQVHDDTHNTVLSGGSAALPGGLTDSSHSSGYTAYGVTPDASGNVTLTLTVTAPGNVAHDTEQDLTVVARAYDPAVDAGEQTLGNNVATQQQTVHLTVHDTPPVANPDTADVNEGGGTFNLMVVIDVSGSMGDDSGVSNGHGGDYTRLELEQQALDQLLQSFNQPGVSLNVQLITFSDTASSSSIFSGGTAISGATSFINGLSTQNTTNYDAAITAAQNSTLFNNSAGATNLVYFLSDGQPNQPNGSVGINSTEQAAWDAFLTNHNATSNAVGVGDGINSTAITELQHVDSDGNITIVTDASTLVTDLTALLPQSVSGNVTTNDAPGLDGWAAVKVVDLVVDGNHYSASSAVGGAVIGKTADTLTIQTTLGGVLTFNFDTGAYTYNAPAVTSDQHEHVGYTIQDGSGDQASSSLDITVHNLPDNTAPVNTVPGAQTTNEDTAKFITGLSISDADAGTGSMTVTLAVQHGTITVDLTGSGATADNNGSGSVTLHGTVAQIDAALAGNHVSYAPSANYNGGDTLTMTTNDNGHTGQGGAKSDTDTVGITVNPVDDAPVNTVPGNQAADAGVQKSITGLSISDVDAGNGSMTVTLSVAHGTLNVTGASGIANNNTGTVTLTGTLTAINTLLGTVKYTATSGYSGGDTLTINTNDNGNTGSGGPLSDQDTVGITVTIPNTPPVAGADHIYTNVTGLFSVSDSLLLLNDTDAQTPADIAVTAAAAASGQATFFENGTPVHSVDHVNIDLDIGNGSQRLGDGETTSFNYTLSDGHGMTSTGTAEVTYQDTTHTLTGSTGSDIIIAGTGNDTIDGQGAISGHDHIAAGAGDDRIIYHTGDIIDGGTNSNASLAGNAGYLGDVLDVSHLASGTVDIHGNIANLSHLETIDATNSAGHTGNQAIILQASDVIALSDDKFDGTSFGTDNYPNVAAIKVEGSAGDSLKLDDTSGQWHNVTAAINNEPSGHQVYAFDSNGGALDAGHVTAYVIVNNNVTVTDHNGNTIGA